MGRWRPYLLVQTFKRKTDQLALKYLLEQKTATKAQQWWISELMGYDFKIEYKRGGDNKVADALSRKMEDEFATLVLISFPTPAGIEEFKQSYVLSPKIDEIVTKNSFLVAFPCGCEFQPCFNR